MPLRNKAGVTARMFNERRSAERNRAVKGGLIRFERGTMQCVVRNISSRGARLSFADVSSVPDTFQLKIGADGEWRGATARWKRGSEVGVSFDRTK